MQSQRGEIDVFFVLDFALKNSLFTQPIPRRIRVETDPARCHLFVARKI